MSGHHLLTLMGESADVVDVTAHYTDPVNGGVMTRSRARRQEEAGATSGDKMWGVGAGGVDFAINLPNRPDLVSAVRTIPVEGGCAICDTTNAAGETLAVAMGPLAEAMDVCGGLRFLQAVAPHLATRETVELHYDHGIANLGDNMKNMAKRLLTQHYKIAMALSKDYAMVVTANNEEYTVPNDRHIKNAAIATNNFDKLARTIILLEKTFKDKRNGEVD